MWFSFSSEVLRDLEFNTPGLHCKLCAAQWLPGAMAQISGLTANGVWFLSEPSGNRVGLPRCTHTHSRLTVKHTLCSCCSHLAILLNTLRYIFLFDLYDCYFLSTATTSREHFNSWWFYKHQTTLLLSVATQIIYTCCLCHFLSPLPWKGDGTLPPCYI